ncbi:MAG TPA: DUF4265 domain-containing protein [Rudaea sp.]|nr:DUF4265 domain-containing protein [Rudaea sp.]
MDKIVREAVHQAPAWRKQSNFIIAAKVSGNEGKTEQLWARKINEHLFEICCIPFFIYNLALGDVVETDADYIVQRVVKQSGRYVFRAWFGESNYPSDSIAEDLAQIGATIEWSSPNLLAVDATDEKHAQQIADFLAERQRAGHLMYETGRS